MERERWQQVEHLYQAAVDLEEDERAAFLDEVCGTGGDLRHEVEVLLAGDAQAGSFIESPAIEVAAWMLARQTGASTKARWAGTRVSHYRIVQTLGGGGMGVVYEAEDMRLHRRVAIKFLPEALANDPLSRKRFQREARAASALNHPNICTLHDIGEHEGHPFIVMELLEGVTLRRRMAEGALPLEQVLDFAVQIAGGLDAAHSAGIMHRDIHPGNIFVTGSGQLKILDFGLAKPAGLPARESSSGETTSTSSRENDPTQPFNRCDLTGHGAMMGTVGYMSPEQTRGENVNVRSDLFSFGTVLYEMATGRRPFTGKTSAMVYYAILGQDPRPPSELNPALPLELERIITKAVEKEPAKRYQQASELHSDLKRLKRKIDSGPAPAVAKEEGAARAFHKPIHRLLRLLAGAGLVVSLGALLLLNVGRWRDRLTGRVASGHIRSLAVLPFENLSADASQGYLVDGMTDEVITDLAQLHGLTVISRTSVMSYKGTKKRLPEIGRELRVDAVLEGSVLKAGDKLRITAQLIAVRTDRHLWAQSYEQRSGDVLSLQDQVAAAIAQQVQARIQGQFQTQPQPQTDPPSARPASTEAYDAYLEGRYFWNQRTEASFGRAIDYFNQAIAKDANYAAAYAGLADCYLLLGESGMRLREEVFPKARSAAEAALRLNDKLGEAHASLGALDHIEGRPGDADKEFRRAIELSPGYATAHQWYAEFLGGTGQYEQAIAEINRARQLDPLSVLMNTQVGYILYLARKPDEAQAQLQRTLEMDPGSCLAHGDLAAVYLDKKMFPAAVSELRKYQDLCPGGKASLIQLAGAYAFAGQSGQARKTLGELPDSDRRNPVLFPYLALAYVALGDKPEALDFLKRAIEQRTISVTKQSTPPLFDPLIADTWCADLLRRADLLE